MKSLKFVIAVVVLLGLIPTAVPAQSKAGCNHVQEQVAKLKKMDVRLDALVEKMKKASQQDKLQAMQDVILEMISQRKEMREMMSHDHTAHGGTGKGCAVN